MPDAAQILARLQARRLDLPALESTPNTFVLPHYEGLGIANLPATLGALFGLDLPGLCPPLETDIWAGWGDGLRRVVLLVVDALGYLQLQEAMATREDLVFSRLAQAGRLVPLTSTWPSTTNNVLTTLWTGYSPAAHGVLAYELYLRELGTAVSALFFWPVAYPRRDLLAEWGIDPETFVPMASLGTRLERQGIVTHAFINKAYSGSLLSRLHSRGVQTVHGFASGGDLWSGLRQAIQARARNGLSVVYWDTIDSITHQCGPQDEAWELELRGLSWMIENMFLDRLAPGEREGTLLLITADHGGLYTPPQAAVELDHHPQLREMLTLPPLGESRVPFWHLRPETLAEAQAYLQEHLSGQFVVLTREQVLGSGLLGPGPVYKETPHRLGDLVGLALGSHYLAREQRQLKMLGRHGGLSAQEMLVPLLGVRLDAL